MGRLKAPLTAILGLFFAIDAIVGYRLWESGWPKHISLTSTQKGAEQVQVTWIPFTGSDWLILILVIGIHAFLCYLVWRAWRSSPVRAV
jgi:hypothetical protein